MYLRLAYTLEQHSNSGIGDLLRVESRVTVRERMNHGKLVIWKANNLRSSGWVEVVTRSSANTRLTHQSSRSACGVIDVE